MKLDKIKRMAARIMKAGINRVWMNPDEGEKIAESMTKEDIRTLIKDGLIRKSRTVGASRGRAKALHEKKRKGRKRGGGKKKGRKAARMGKKSLWIKGVRAQRKMLRELKKSKVKAAVPYSKLYKMVKGNYFRGKKYVDAFVRGAKK